MDTMEGISEGFLFEATPDKEWGNILLYPSARYRNCSVMIDLVIIGCQYKRNQEGRICFKEDFCVLSPNKGKRGRAPFFVSATDRESQHGLPDRMDWSASQVRTGTGNVHSGVPCRQPIQKPGAGYSPVDIIEEMGYIRRGKVR